MKPALSEPDFFLIDTPVSVGVTAYVGAAVPVEHPKGHPDAAVSLPFALVPALLDHVQRVACEAARGALTSHPSSVSFMESETNREGWRAFLQADTAHLIHVLEASGLAEFRSVDDT